MKKQLQTIINVLSVIGLVSLATVSGQTLPGKPIETEPLEKYDNPPAFIYRLETGPRMISQFGPFVSYQVNVDSSGNNIIGDAANECSIAVDPTDGNKMTIGWRQFNSVSSNFRQGGWGFTTDGGTTWTFPGVLENNVFRSDPVLNANDTGTFFYLSLLESFCDDMWGSTNGAQSWMRLPSEGGGGGGDKQWFTIDKTNGMGHGFQYQAWIPRPLAVPGNLTGPQTEESPGKVRSVSRIRRFGEHSTWPATAMFLLVAQATLAVRSGVFAPVTRRTQVSHQRLIKALR